MYVGCPLVFLMRWRCIQKERFRFKTCVIIAANLTQGNSRIKIDSIDIETIIEKARALIGEDKQMSAATKSMFEVLILLISLPANRLNLNSSNSSKPSYIDPNRKKKPKRKSDKKPGGQKGHVGTTLKKVDDPDKIKPIKVDRSKLPPGQYRRVDFEARRVFDIDISSVIIFIQYVDPYL